MQSATSIQFSDRAKNTFDQGGQRMALTVDFWVFKRGPAHVAGIIFSPDFWGSRNEALAPSNDLREILRFGRSS